MIRPAVHRQRGLSLISIMIAIVLASFLLLILFKIWDSTRTTFATNSSLTQLQSEERLATAVIANTVHMAGYYPLYLNYTTSNPTPSYSSLDFKPSGGFQSGQFISGTYSASAPGDSLSVRFLADRNTDTLDCQGQPEATGSLVTETFSVNNSGDLQCAVNGGTPVTLAANVRQLSVLYGVDTQGDGSAHQYLNAAQVSSQGKWPTVLSAMVTLSFKNPFAGQSGQPDTLSIRRIMALLQTVH